MNGNYTDIIDDLGFLSKPRPLLWLSAAILILLIIYLVYKLRKRHRKTSSLDKSQKSAQEEAYVDALAELEKLRSRMSRENSRVYAIEASAIVRKYIEQRFMICAPMRSTEEFFIEAQKSDKLDESDRKVLNEFLSACDFLKFAKAWAEMDELGKIHSLAVEFVKKTHNHTPQQANTENPTENVKTNQVKPVASINTAKSAST
ncbi:MAG: hypothetical protein N2487_04795 [Verrucomicrobiae bacterium]|nr:hypothetical protein [Verrucomicrobiae bacterium]